MNRLESEQYTPSILPNKHKRPTSKVIQMVVNTGILTVLCEDGSIWLHYNGDWGCILEGK